MKYQKLTYLVRWVFAPLVITVAWTLIQAAQVPGPLVESNWLADHQGEVVILDVRHDASSYLGKPVDPTDKPNLEKPVGHIPGAISVPWKKIVVKGEEQGVALKGMLPSPEAFTQLMQSSGVSKDSAIVIAGRGSTAKDQAYATRLYFSLKYFGHDNVALLNGGTAQWAKQGRPLSYTAEQPMRGDFSVVEIRKHLLASTGEVENAIKQGDVQLIDCRTEDFYLGTNYKRKFVSPEHKGHLSGAKTLPFVLMAENWAPAKLLSRDEISKMAALKGVDLTQPTITYCNTGVIASMTWYVLHELEGNQQTQLYDGSMHAWSTLSPESRVFTLAEASDKEVAPETKVSVGESAKPGPGLLGPQISRQSLVDERRNELRRRREQYYDTLPGRHYFKPHWMIARNNMLDDYRDKRREMHRQQRDIAKSYQDAYRRIYNPRSAAIHDQAKAMYFAYQMNQLENEEFLDRLRLNRIYGLPGPFGY